MNKIKNILKITSVILLTTVSVVAQEEEKKSVTTFAGSADFYYRYAFAANDSISNSRTSFTNSHNSFELGMASIEASHKMGKASVFVDLGFGKRAQEFSYNDGASTFMIKQLYFTYEFTDKFKVIAGSFGTHIGYELLDAVDNKNYSMSYAFTNGPFFNTGVKAQYTAGKFTAMLGITNATDFKTAAEAGSAQKALIGQLGYVADSGSVYFNFTTGSSNPSSSTNLTQLDITASKKLSDKFSLGLNGTYAMLKDDFASAADANWFAAVVYAGYAFNDNAALAYRVEYFDDKDGAKLGLLDNNVIANTLSFNLKEGNFTFIPEVRFDASAKDTFFKSDATGTKSAASILLATTYSF